MNTDEGRWLEGIDERTEQERQDESQAALPSENPDDHHGGCPNRHCVCWDPTRWPLCEEWMGIPETGRWCPRCGWAEHLHRNTNDAGRSE